MSLHIAFTWTSHALVAGYKTVTRRQWKPHYARRFAPGVVVTAYDRQPQYRGTPLATIEIVQQPYLENTLHMPDDDYEAEGFGFYSLYPELRAKRFQQHPMGVYWRAWRLTAEDMWVVRFRLVDLLPDGVKMLEPVNRQLELL